MSLTAPMVVVILAQSAATSRAYAARYNERFSEDTDLVGLGLANIGAGLSGTFVVNGSPTKTQMIDIKGMQSIFAQRRSEFWVALITTLMVVFVGVEQGILLAIALSLIDHTRRGYRPKNALLMPGESGAE